jgi:asparagine synthase (glutamine-hydrolysing)
MAKLSTMLHAGKALGVRGSMLRLQYEVQRGSGLMSKKMRSVQGWDSWELKRIGPGFNADAILRARQNCAIPFFFTDAQLLAAQIREIIGPNGASSAIAEAERILTGYLPFFGSLSCDCGFPPRWFQNPVTGQSVSPREPWTRMRFASPAYGDLKFILEPSRFLFIYPLLRAYALTGDEKVPEAFWTAIEDWSHHSPPMHGPLWVCGQECSLRILAWTFALHGFIHSPSTTNERVSMLLSMIAAHAWRITQSLAYARSQRSNHLITEAVGLWTAGTLFPELARVKNWQRKGAELLRESVLDQITPQGASQQHSFNYQRMILQLLLWTLRLSEIHDTPLHESIRLRTQAAFDFLRQWVDTESGLAPNYGSDDGSHILPLSSAAYRDFRPLLQLGAAVLDRPALPPGPWDEAPLWLGVKPRNARQAQPSPIVVCPAETGSSETASSETGYFLLGDDTSWAMIRAGRYTRRPFQADQLHLDLWWKGINLARDAGTYLYNGPPPWNNGFARTAVHNTVTVDGEDQMRRAGRFLWLDWAQASGRVNRATADALPDRFEGEHHGYRRLGVIHRRSVQWLPNYGWVIVDDLEGTGEHTLSLHWLTADLPFKISDEASGVTLKSKPFPITWNIFSSAPATSTVVRAGEPLGFVSAETYTQDVLSQLGWEAATYGDLRPAISILCRTCSLLPVRFVTVVLTNQQVKVLRTESEIAILHDEQNSADSMAGAKNFCEKDSAMYRVKLDPSSAGAAKPSRVPLKSHFA